MTSRSILLLIALAGTVPAHLASQTRPDQAAFRDLYRELVETWRRTDAS